MKPPKPINLGSGCFLESTGEQNVEIDLLATKNGIEVVDNCGDVAIRVEWGDIARALRIFKNFKKTQKQQDTR